MVVNEHLENCFFDGSMFMVTCVNDVFEILSGC